MRHAVLMAALTFGAHRSRQPGALSGAARGVGSIVIALLDRRRRAIDQR